MSVVVTRLAGYSAAAPGDAALFIRRKGQAAGTGPGIVALHGHGADSLTWLLDAGALSPGRFCNVLAEEGYRILAIDDGGGTTWGDQSSVDRIADAVAWLQAGRGSGYAGGDAAAGKVGLMAWSMGTTAALNYAKRNAGKLGALWAWAPVTDVAWARAQAAWTAEVDAAYGGSFAANSAGYRIADELATFRGIAPMTLAHADDDATVPSSQTDAFVAGVADARVVKRRVTAGGHAGLFAGVPEAEVAAFFRSALPAPA